MSGQTDFHSRLAKAQRAYERARAWRATLVALPVAFSIAAIVLGLGARPPTVLGLGFGLFVLTWMCLWRGQSLGRAVLPGIFAGLIPLVLALFAQSYGHVCTSGGCMSLCVPACVLGGGLAGFIVARTSRFAAARVSFIAAASSLALMVGSLGCSCVGYGGVLGLVAGLTGALIPSTLVMRRA